MADTIDDSKTKLILKNVYATYVNEKNDKYGRSIAVLAYDELGGHIQEDRIDEITKWVEENKIGSGDKAGKPHFTHFEMNLKPVNASILSLAEIRNTQT